MHTALSRALCTTHCTNGSQTTQLNRNAWRKAKLQFIMPDLPKKHTTRFPTLLLACACALSLSSESNTLISMHRTPLLFSSLRSPRADVPVARLDLLSLFSIQARPLARSPQALVRTPSYTKRIRLRSVDSLVASTAFVIKSAIISS